MAKTASKKVFRHGSVTVALTVLIVAAVILLNASVTLLGMRFGWFLNMNPNLAYPVTETCYDYLETHVIPNAGEDIRLIFCESEEEIAEDYTFSMIHSTARDLSERYPDTVKIEYLNVWEQPSIARFYGVKSSTSVVVVSGEEHRVCSLRDFFLFPAGDTTNPVAYIGEKRFAVAMKAVVSENNPIAYFTLNHGESTPDYSLMYTIIDAGYTISYLDALSFDIPEDCALLVTYAPARDYTVEDGVSGISEIDKLDAYLARGGKFMTFISADTFAAGGYKNLEGYLATWGVTFDHATGAGGIEECNAIRDTAHALTADGYTILGQIPTVGNAATVLDQITGSLRAANATGISIAEDFTASNGNYVNGSRTLSPYLRSHVGAEAWAGGRAVGRTDEGYNLITLTEDSSTGGQVFVSASTEFADEASLQSGVFDNGPFLLTTLQEMGAEDVPIALSSQPLSDDTIHSLTTAQARTITITLVAAPVIVALAVGLFVLIRRKFA